MTHSPFRVGPTDARKMAGLDLQGTYIPALSGTITQPTTSEAVGAWHVSGHALEGWARFVITANGSGVYRVTVPFLPNPRFIEGSDFGQRASSVGWGRAIASTGTDSRLCSAQFMTDMEHLMLPVNSATGSPVPTTEAVAGTSAAWTHLMITFGYLVNPSELPSP